MLLMKIFSTLITSAACPINYWKFPPGEQLPLSWEMHQTEANSVKLLRGMMIAV